jgi:hypothetical protein
LSRLRRSAIAFGGLVTIVAIVAGCAAYRSGMQPVLDDLSRGDAAAALAQLDRSPREDDALYQLERALLLRAEGRFDESSRAFDDADRIAEDLYTRSVSNEAASLLTSDRIRPYRPAPHERLLARTFLARNYAERGDLEGAVVEARRIERLLDELQDASGGEVREWIPLTYLTAGLLQEAAGNPDDALRIFRRLYVDAAQAGGDTVAFSTWLPRRMRRLALGSGVDLDDLLGPAGKAQVLGAAAPFTAVVYFEQGFVPPREEFRLDVPILKIESGKDAASLGPIVGDRVVCMRDGRCRYEPVEIDYWLALAVPTYGPDHFRPLAACGGWKGVEVDAFPVADVALLARGQLNRDMPSIMARTAIRALLKFGAERQARKAGGDVGGILANLLGAATERAETRTWLTLPREISMAVIDLPAATDTIRVGWVDSGRVREEAIPLRRLEGTNFGFASRRIWR